MKRDFSDKELIKGLGVDEKTLARFRQIQRETIAEAKKLYSKRSKKITVLGISGSMRDEYDYSQENSNSEALLEVALDECKRMGAEVEMLKLRKYSIKPCKACYSTTNTQCHFYCSCYAKGTPEGDDMSNIIYDKILAADAIIFATPTNNFKVSSPMSLFIDRCISLDGSLQPANKKQPKDRELNKKHTRFIELTADQDVPGSGFLRRFAGKVAGIIATGHEEGASMAISSMFMTFSHWGMIFPPYGNMYAMSSICYPTHADKKIVLDDCHKREIGLVAKNVMEATKIASDKKNKWAYDYSIN